MQGVPPPGLVAELQRRIDADDVPGAIGHLRSQPDDLEGVWETEDWLRETLPKEHLYAQRGPQERFLASSAEIIIYGGAAGSAKTWAALFWTLRFAFTVPRFRALYFRKNTKQLLAGGGMWDEAQDIWSCASKFRANNHTVVFPGGATAEFSHFHDESKKGRVGWKGAQPSMCVFEEMTEYLEGSWIYLMSRLRNAHAPDFTCRMIGTTNPDADSWVRNWVAPWVGREHPLYGTVRDGEHLHLRVIEDDIPDDVVPHLLHRDGIICWVTPDCPEAKSITYIGAKLSDNRILMNADPGYRANLEGQSRLDRARLLHGDWDARAEAGLFFKREDFMVVPPDQAPECWRTVRSWDFGTALVQASGGHAPDYWAGVKMGIVIGGAKPEYVIYHADEFRATPAQGDARVRQHADADGARVPVVLQQSKGSSGPNVVSAYKRYVLKDRTVILHKLDRDKLDRASVFSVAVEERRVWLVDGPWVSRFISQHENFPDSMFDDLVDAACVGAIELEKLSLTRPGTVTVADEVKRTRKQW